MWYSVKRNGKYFLFQCFKVVCEYNLIINEPIAAAGHCTRLVIDSCACDSGYCGAQITSVNYKNI